MTPAKRQVFGAVWAQYFLQSPIGHPRTGIAGLADAESVADISELDTLSVEATMEVRALSGEVFPAHGLRALRAGAPAPGSECAVVSLVDTLRCDCGKRLRRSRTTTAPKGCSQLAAPAFASSIAIAIAMKCSCWLAIRESPESRHYRDPVSVAQLGGGRNIFARYLVHYEDESGKALVRVMTFQQRPDRMPEVVTSIDWLNEDNSFQSEACELPQQRAQE